MNLGSDFVPYFTKVTCTEDNYRELIGKQIKVMASIEPETALASGSAIENKEVNVKIIVTDKTDEEQVASHEKVDSNQQSTVGHLLCLFCFV